MTTREPRTTILLAAVLATSACSSAEQSSIPWCHESFGPGSVNVGAHFAGCPEITSYEVVPIRLSPGESAQLIGNARDIDSTNLSFSWSAESGTVTNANSATTAYRCKGGEGIVKLTFIVSDGTCQDVVEAAIDCIP